jgi:hypothetical protein
MPFFFVAITVLQILAALFAIYAALMWIESSRVKIQKMSF